MKKFLLGMVVGILGSCYGVLVVIAAALGQEEAKEAFAASLERSLREVAYRKKSDNWCQADSSFTFQTRADAQRVLDGMREIVKTYSVVSYGDLLELVGVPRKPIDDKTGWDNLDKCRVTSHQGHYRLYIPEAPKSISVFRQ